MTTHRPAQDTESQSSDDSTFVFWDSRASRRLTPEEQRVIRENLSGFFRVLQDWARAGDQKQEEHISSP